MTIVKATVLALLLATVAAACSKDATTTAPSTSATTTLTFSSALVAGGASSHAFVVSKAGTITVPLASLGAAGPVGLGLGIPNPSGTGCNLTMAVTTSAGANPQLTAAVEAGSYCVRIYDIGRLADSVGFAITIVHP